MRTRGVAFDHRKTHAYLDELDGFDLGEGWYRDGPVRRVDHYIPFAMHFYGMIYAVLAKGDEARKDRFRGSRRDLRQRYPPLVRRGWRQPLPSAAARPTALRLGGFWGALAFAGRRSLPWGEIKGHYMRHIRWWAAMPIADRDGVLSVGYGYPNLFMSESYNSPGSPYWALKFFLPLALPGDHPFWAAEEAPQPEFPEPVALKPAGMVAMHTPGNVVVLSSGQQHDKMLGANEKYSKFVYSTRYAFNVEADDREFSAASFDGMLGLSDDGVHFRMRETLEEALIAGDLLYSRWRPWSDVTVETWLLPEIPGTSACTASPRHARCMTIEGGFAIERADFNADPLRCRRWPGRLVRSRPTSALSSIYRPIEGPAMR